MVGLAQGRLLFANKLFVVMGLEFCLRFVMIGTQRVMMGARVIVCHLNLDTNVNPNLTLLKVRDLKN